MKKTLLSLGILGILFFGTGNVFASPMQRPNNPPRIEKHQPQHINHKQNHKTIIVRNNYVAPAPRRSVAPPPTKHHVVPPPPKHHVAHKPVVIAQQPYYNYGYNNGFALKIGNFFLSI